MDETRDEASRGAKRNRGVGNDTAYTAGSFDPSHDHLTLDHMLNGNIVRHVWRIQVFGGWWLLGVGPNAYFYLTSVRRRLYM
jgi:hypothetical protein